MVDPRDGDRRTAQCITYISPHPAGDRPKEGSKCVGFIKPLEDRIVVKSSEAE